jgi:AAHS family 4-hydroxybenzoate transporter-like MFS transporter
MEIAVRRPVHMQAESVARDIDVEQVMDGRMSGLQKRVVALCCMATFLDGYDTQALGMAVPRIAEQWSLSPSAFAAALSGSLIGIALGAVLLAPLADRYGRRPSLIAMMLVVGLSTFGAAVAANLTALTVLRVITGLGLGGSVPIATAMTSEYAPTRRRAALVALMIACMALGSFGAGIIAPIVSHAWGWRGIFAVGAVLPIAMAALLAAALPESLRFLILRDKNLSSAIAQLKRIAPHHAGRVPVIVARGTVAQASVATLFDPIYRMRTILVWTIFWFNLFVIYSLISWTPTLLHAAGWAHDTAQRASGLIALGGIVGGLLMAWVADRGFAIAALFTAYVGTAVVFSFFSLGPASVTVWVVLLLLAGAGAVGGQMAAGSVAAAYYYPPELRSTGVGWFNGVGRIGGIVGPLALASLMRAGWATAHILGFLSVPMLLCAGGVLLLPRALRTEVM